MRFSLTLLALALLPNGASQAASVDWAEIYKRAKPSIPVLVVNGAGCAGALVSPNEVLTAAHCVWTLRGGSVTWPGQLGVYTEFEVIVLDRENDLAILRLPEPLTRPVLAVAPKDPPPLQGSPVATIGHPSVAQFWSNPPFDPDMTYLISTGVVSGVTEKDIISDLSISPGNSGGPVLDEQGRIIGVTSRKRVDHFVGNIGFMANPKKIGEALERAKSAPAGWHVPVSKAHTALNLGLDYSFNSLVKRFRPGEQDYFVFEVSLDLLDRLRVGYSVDLFVSAVSFQSFLLGWKFPIRLPNRAAIFLTPAAERVFYDFNTSSGSQITTARWGGSIEAGISGFPLHFKFTGFDFEGSFETIFTLKLVAPF